MPIKWAKVLAAVVIAGGGVHSAAAADLRVVSRPDSVWTMPAKISNGIPEDSMAEDLPYKGDPAGIRRWLASHGIEYSLIYTNDVLSNLRGGLQRGTINQGKLETTVSVDAEKLLGIKGLSFYANSFQIHNTGRIRRDYVGGINTIAAIEAQQTTRLSELWMEQSFWDGKASVRLGQLVADLDFFDSELSVMFLQSDWATITAVNLPSGGPAYPLSTPGIRLKFDPNPNATFLMAIFNGDPAGPGWPGEEQIRNLYGLNFRLKDPAFIIGEAEFRTNHGKTDVGLASTLKFGAWSHLGEFADYRYANDGTLLADPNGSGEPARRRRNSGVYGVFEQQLFRPRGGDPYSGISVFGRISTSPSDRNLVDFFMDGGVVVAGLVPGRPHDKFGASYMYSRFSKAVRAFDLDNQILNGSEDPIRDYEANLELTYMFQMMTGWTVQPVFTYVWHPSGTLPDAAVIGGRSIWQF
ncbi:MAG: carbohydrate porin [Xanthobacteraceae bacterium]